MARLRSHPELLLVIIALALWAGCAKRPVGLQRTSNVPSSPPPVAVAPAPAPEAARPVTPLESGRTTDVPVPSTPVTPLQGGQRPAVAEFRATDALKDIHFDFDRYNIRQDAADTLTANAAWMKSNPGTAILVEGHCDERGTVEYNLALGQRRAQSARDFLVGQGVPATRLTTISYGKERPICSESTEDCWARNRRAHFLSKPS